MTTWQIVGIAIGALILGFALGLAYSEFFALKALREEKRGTQLLAYTGMRFVGGTVFAAIGSASTAHAVSEIGASAGGANIVIASPAAPVLITAVVFIAAFVAVYAINAHMTVREKAIDADIEAHRENSANRAREIDKDAETRARELVTLEKLEELRKQRQNASSQQMKKIHDIEQALLADDDEVS